MVLCMDDTTMPPTGTGQDKVKRPVSLPEATWKKIEALRDGTGEHASETLRRIINEGILAENERMGAMLDAESKRLSIENQRLINRRLQAKEQDAESAVARLKTHTDPEVKADALLFEKWLQKG
jgi:hypothetical protein